MMLIMGVLLIMKSKLFQQYLVVASSTKIPGVIDLIETWSPFDDCIAVFGLNPKKKDFISFWLQTVDENTIFPSRYYADRARKESPWLNSSYHIIKVCNGSVYGFACISPRDYQARKLQR